MGAMSISPISRRVMNLGHLLVQASDLYPANAAIVWGDRAWTWSN